MRRCACKSSVCTACKKKSKLNRDPGLSGSTHTHTMAKFATTKDLSVVLLFSLLISVVGISVLNYRFMVDLMNGMDKITNLLTPKPIKTV